METTAAKAAFDFPNPGVGNWDLPTIDKKKIDKKKMEKMEKDKKKDMKRCRIKSANPNKLLFADLEPEPSFSDGGEKEREEEKQANASLEKLKEMKKRRDQKRGNNKV